MTSKQVSGQRRGAIPVDVAEHGVEAADGDVVDRDVVLVAASDRELAIEWTLAPVGQRERTLFGHGRFLSEPDSRLYSQPRCRATRQSARRLAPDGISVSPAFA